VTEQIVKTVGCRLIRRETERAQVVISIGKLLGQFVFEFEFLNSNSYIFEEERKMNHPSSFLSGSFVGEKR
jgi:hypothetical protein